MLITNLNEEQSLLKRLDLLIAESEEMRVLVGFFYFRGISALHSGLTKNKDFQLKILSRVAQQTQRTVVERAGPQGGKRI